MQKNRLHNTADRSSGKSTIESRFKRFTRVMAAFTASLFLVSSNLSLPVLANQQGGQGGGHRLQNNPMFEGMNRREIRQQIRQERRETNLNLQNINNGIVPQPNLTNVGNSPGGRNSAAGGAAHAQLNKVHNGKSHQIRNTHQVFQQQNSGRVVRLDNGANLNLTSDARNITLGDKLFSDAGSVVVEIGGEKKTLYAGSQVTAAEYVAAKQALNGGQQLVVDANGKATGGTVDLNTVAATRNTMRADSLTVASGVTAVGDFGKHSGFRMAGDLDNYGSVYAVSSGARRSGEIRADNITNQSGALISSNAGSNFGNKGKDIDLTLTADNNFSNLGTVESSGSLTINAGNSINNGSGASVSAKSDLNVNAPNVVNAGTMAATNGDLTVDTPTPAALNVNNNGGSLQALNGAINVRAPSYNAAFNSTVTGGDLLSKELNLHAGQGNADIDVNELTGQVSGAGLAAHVKANTENLTLGKICLTGDPTFYNTGNMTLNGDISVGEALAILAEGNITGTNLLTNITAQNGGGAGQQINIIAGFNLTSAGPTSPTVGPFPGTGTPIGAGETVGVANGGATGGNIDFTASPTLTIDASSATPFNGQNGGGVNLIARSTGGVNGRILLPTNSFIDTSGAAGAANGNINVVAGSTSGVTTIQLGTLTAAGGPTSTGGNIVVRTAQPSANAGTTFDEFGNLSAGGFTVGATNANPGIVIGGGTGQFITANGTITINSGNGGTNLNLAGGSLTAQNGAVNITSTGTTTLTAVLLSSDQGDINISGNGGLTVNSDSIFTNGADLTFAASNGNLAVTTAGNSISTNGGDVNFSAAGDITLTLPVISTANGAGNSGNVTLEADSNDNGAGDLLAGGTAIDTANGAGFNGGNIALDSGDNAGEVLQVGALGSNATAGTGGNISFGLLSGDAGDITVGGATNAGNGTFTVDANTNNHSLTLGGDVRTSAVNINLGTGSVFVPNTGFNFITDSYAVTATNVNAGTGDINFLPLTAGTTIGVAGGAGTLNISTVEFNQIIANSVTFGDLSSGDITLGSSLNVSGAGAGKFNLGFVTGGNFIGGANTITLGNKDLVILANNNITTGDVTSTTGDIGLGAGNDLTTGVLTTASGNISVSAGNNMTLGGVNSGTGTFTSNSNNGDVTVTGTVTGTTDFVITTTGDITVGSIILTGPGTDILLTSTAGSITTTGDLQADPINMIAAIDVNIGGDLTANDGIIVIAGRNINSTTTFDVNANNPTGAGGDVVFVAGANFTDSVGNVVINGASGTGGSINITGGGGLGTLTTAGGAGSGGDVTLVAFSNGANGGQVLAPTSSQIITTGSTIPSGSVTVIAGALTGAGIQLGTINTTTSAISSIGSGPVVLATATPTTPVTISKPNGAIAGTFTGGPLTGSSILAGNITARGSTVAVLSDSNVALGAVNVSANTTFGSGGFILIQANGTDALDVGVTGGSNYVQSVSANGGTSSGNGGFISVTNLGTTGLRVAPIAIQVASGNGGNIVLDGDQGNVQLLGGVYSVNGGGASGNAGTITINGSGLTSTGNATLSSLASGTGFGGQISVTTSGTTPLNIGTGAGQIQFNLSGPSDQLDLNIGGTITLFNTSSLSADTINLTTTQTGSDINLNGAVTAIDLTIDSNDAVTVASNVTGSNTLSVTAGGNITTNGAGILNGGDIDITSTNGNIGNNAFARLNVDATASLTVNAFNGSAFLNDPNSVTLNTASTAANTFDLQATGAIITVLGGTIGANDVVLRSVGSTITLGDVVTGGTSVSLRANGNLTTPTGSGLIVSPSVNLRSDNGTIGTGTGVGGRFQLDADFVTANATGLIGAAFLQNANAIDVGPGPSAVTTTFDLLAGGNISNSGTITAADVVLNTGGSFNISNLIIGTNSISLTSVGSIVNGNLAGTLIAPQINLTTSGNIGSSTLSRFNIDASSVTLTAAGSVFLNDANDLNIGPTASSAGGVFDVLAGNNLTTTGTINAANIVLRATNGSLDLGANATATVSANLRANGNVTTSGGAVLNAPNMTLTSDNGNIGTSVINRFNIDANNLSASAVNGSIFIGDSDDLNLSAPGVTADNIVNIVAQGNLSTSAPVSGDNVVLSSITGTVTLGDVVTGNSLTINSFGDITNATVGAVLTFDTLILNSTNGSVGQVGNLLLTDANNLTVTAANDVHIDELDSVTLNTSSAGQAFELIAGGDINVNGNVTATAGAVDLNAGGKFNFIADSTITAGTTVTLTSTTATTGGAGVDVTLIGPNTVTVTQDFQTGGDFTANSANAGGQVNVQAVNAGGDISLVAPFGTVLAEALTAGGDITVNSPSNFTTNGNITATGDVTLITNALTVTDTISGANVTINSEALATLTIDGSTGGTITATSGVTTLNSFNGDLTFNGILTFNGTTNVNPATNFAVVVNNNAVVTGNDTVNLNTCTLILNGNGTITGDPLNFNCPLGAGTIANSSGDVDLTGVGLVFNGQSLAIIASGSVIGGTATTINLSGTAGSGGNLLVVAGFDFTPATGGQVNNSPVIYTFGGPSASGGNVDLGGVNILTNGTVGGDAGDITIIAHAGNVNAGTVATGSLTANSAGGTGGDILVIAQGGFTINGTISNTGAVNGTVTLAAAEPLITGGVITVQNGEQAGPGQFTIGQPQAAGTIANSNGDVDLSALTLTFVGLDLAIIASGDVIAGTNTSINLSNNAGDGGNLLVVAGFDFSPATVGQVNFDAANLYTFGAESATGGDIILGTLNITTAATGATGNGGNVTLVANGATGFATGTVNVGNINTSSVNGFGGDVLVIAEGGFNVGTPNVIGGAGNGTLTLAAAEPTITGGAITVKNGIQGGPGQFTFTVPTGNGTIANSNGNVDLTGLTLNFTGLDLAIIASGDVLAGTNTSINLSNGGGNGGDLLVVAGFNFSPATAGQVNFNSGTLYTFGGQSATGGDIVFTGLSINTSATGAAGDGGNVTLVANGAPLGNLGTISTGNINTSSANGNGGDLLVIAEGGFTLGTINTTGALSNGTQTLASATPVITGGVITVQNGTQGGPGQFTFTTPTGNGTIANSTGDVTLTGNLVFVGLNLAIIAANDINAGTANLIDLSNGAGTGGTLTLIAGFDFAPATAGQVNDNTTTFTMGGPNAAGGNINFGGLNILSNGIVGGDVLAIANGGSSSNGTITTGNIDVSGTTTGGSVNVIGEGGITTGLVDTTGGAGGGSINLNVNQPTITGGQVFITNGNRTGTGTFVTGALGTGTVSTGALTSGDAINIVANNAAGITLASASALNDITVSNVGSITVNGNQTSTAGAISITSNDIAGTVQTLTVANGVTITADDQIDLINAGTDKKNNLRDALIIGTNAVLVTTSKVAGEGDVNIRMGAAGQNELNNNLPKARFTVNEIGPGQLHLFGKKPRGEKPVNTLTAQGADINISLQKGFNAKALVFNGGVQVTADPPVAANAAVYRNGKLISGDAEVVHANNNVGGLLEALTGTTSTLTTSADSSAIGSFNTIENANTISGVNTLGVANTIGTTAGTTLGTANSNTLYGVVNANGDDNSYMVSFEGPTAAADASICSDSDLGTTGIARTAHSQKVVLKKGNVLFVPFQKTVVETEQGTVIIDAKSTVLVSTTNNKLAVYNLDDSHKGAVSVNTNGQNFTLAPGSHATVTNDKAGEFAQVNAIEAIPHRKVTSRVIANGVKVHTSEFSIATAIQTVKPLTAVVHSSNAQAKKVADRLMKTTAILMHLSGNDYQHYFKPSLTAMAK